MSKYDDVDFTFSLRKILNSQINTLSSTGESVESEPKWTTDSKQLWIFDGTSDVQVMVRKSVPSTASSSGNTGDFAIDSDYIYICVATNSWKRVAISTW